MTRRRESRLTLVLALAAFVAVAWWPARPSSADCVTPTLSVAPNQGPPGSTVTISGTNWFEGCYDPSSPAATYQGAPPPRTDSDIRVTFSDGNSVYEVATVTPDGRGNFSFQAQIPPAARQGSGAFRADGSNGSPTAGFAVGQPPPPTTQPPPVTQAPPPRPAGTVTTTARTGGTSVAAPSGSPGDFGSILPSPSVPAVPTSAVIFNPSTPLAPQAGQYFATSGSPFASPSTPPVTLGSTGNSNRDLLWVAGFLIVGLLAGVGYFLYQRNIRGSHGSHSRPRTFR